jgi:hypothetical protein
VIVLTGAALILVVVVLVLLLPPVLLPLLSQIGSPCSRSHQQVPDTLIYATSAAVKHSLHTVLVCLIRQSPQPLS